MTLFQTWDLLSQPKVRLLYMLDHPYICSPLLSYVATDCTNGEVAKEKQTKKKQKKKKKQKELRMSDREKNKENNNRCLHMTEQIRCLRNVTSTTNTTNTLTHPHQKKSRSRQQITPRVKTFQSQRLHWLR